MLRSFTLTIAAIIGLVGVAGLFAAAGQLNTNLGDDGIVTTDLHHATSVFEAMAIQPDGKILAGGDAAGSYGLARLNQDGTLDTTFADGGRGLFDFGGTFNQFLRDLVVLDDGKILGVGRAATGMAVIRWNPNGAVDTGFGNNGISIFNANGQPIDGYALALQSTGKIVAVGRTNPGTATGGFAMARFNPDGSLDGTFAGGGGITNDSNEGPRDVEIDGADRIITVGGTHSFNNTGDVVVQRFTPDGSPDAAFGGGDGIVQQDFSGDFDRGLSVALQDGKIVVGGQTKPGTIDWLVARFNEDGSLDGSFTTLMKDFSGASDAVGDVTVFDSKIAVGGTAANSFGAGILGANGTPDATFGGDGFVQTFVQASGFQQVTNVFVPDGQTVLIGGGNGIMSTLAYTMSGALDPSFGDGGGAFFFLPGADEQANAVVRQPNGKLIAAGYAGAESGMARYNPDGSLDQSFGDGGRVVLNLVQNASERITDIDLQDDGKIVAAVEGDGMLHVARYNTDGSLDTTFGVDGVATIDTGEFAEANAVAVHPDGRIIVAGGSGADGVVAALMPDGALDTSFGANGFALIDVAGTDQYDTLRDVIIRSDGRIAAAGTSDDGNDYVFSAVSLTAAGDPDTSFSGDGVQTIPFDQNDEGKGITELSDGRLAVVGLIDEGDDGFGIVLLNQQGNPDSSFAGDGKLDFNPSTDEVDGAAIVAQPDNKLVVVGTAENVDGADMVIARITPAGAFDDTFAGSGVLALDIAGDYDIANDVIILPDTSLVVAGAATVPLTRSDFALVGIQGDLPPQPPGQMWGDWNCDGVIDGADVLYAIADEADVPMDTPDGCPGLGDSIPGGLTWGNLDCTPPTGANDWRDLLAFVGGVAIEPSAGCPAPGDIVETEF